MTWEVGQIVAFTSGYHSVPQKMKIDRVTPTGLACIGTQKFRQNGDLQGRSTWSQDRIEPWTEAHAKQRHDHFAAVVRSALSSRPVPKAILIEVLEEQLALLKGARRDPR